MADISLLDKSYDKDNSENYHISLQVDPEGFSYCILDPASHRYIAFQKYLLGKQVDTETLIHKLEKCMLEDDLLNFQFNSAFFLYLTQKSTLVPEVFFDESNLRDYFEFNQVLDELDELHYNLIPEIRASDVFAIPTYLANLVYSKFKGVKYYHQAVPFIKSSLNDIPKPTSVHISLNPGFFDVLVKQDNKLRLYNTFLYQNDTDLLYYVLFTIKQLKLDPKTVPFTICGEMSDRISYQESLSRYIPNIMYLDPVSPKFSGIFDRISLHKYFNLFYLYNCE